MKRILTMFQIFFRFFLTLCQSLDFLPGNLVSCTTRDLLKWMNSSKACPLPNIKDKSLREEKRNRDWRNLWRQFKMLKWCKCHTILWHKGLYNKPHVYYLNKSKLTCLIWYIWPLFGLNKSDGKKTFIFSLSLSEIILAYNHFCTILWVPDNHYLLVFNPCLAAI